MESLVSLRPHNRLVSSPLKLPSKCYYPEPFLNSCVYNCFSVPMPHWVELALQVAAGALCLCSLLLVTSPTAKGYGITLCFPTARQWCGRRGGVGEGCALCKDVIAHVCCGRYYKGGNARRLCCLMVTPGKKHQVNLHTVDFLAATACVIACVY